MKKIEFGDKVKFTAIFIRMEKHSKDSYTNDYKFWQKHEKKGSGVFLGYRNLCNGDREYIHDEGYIFTPKEYVKAAMVCPGPRKNPIYVPIECTEKC